MPRRTEHRPGRHLSRRHGGRRGTLPPDRSPAGRRKRRAVITEKDTPFEQRLVEIYESVFDICKRYQPEALSIEKLYYQHNQTTVIGVAEARGVILLAAAQAGLPIYEYTPMQVKQAVTGYGKAVKKQVQEMTRILLHLPAIPKPDDTADALAMAITFCHTNGSQLNRFVRRVPGPI